MDVPLLSKGKTQNIKTPDPIYTLNKSLCMLLLIFLIAKSCHSSNEKHQARLRPQHEVVYRYEDVAHLS